MTIHTFPQPSVCVSIFDLQSEGSDSVHSASGCVIFPFEFLRVKEAGPAQGWGRVQRTGLETWRLEGCWGLKPQRACEVVCINKVCKCVDTKDFLRKVRPTVLRTAREASSLTTLECL